MKKMISQKNYSPYLYIWLFLAAFAVMYAVNFILPFEEITLLYGSITFRAWTWLEILITSIAVFYIFKIKKFTLVDLIVGIILGIIVKYAGWYTYVSAISTTICYYSACQIFRRYNQENKYFNIGIKALIKSLLLGMILAVPFSIINNLAILFSGNSGFKEFNFSNVISSALHALPPGISEEIIFHFFLFAFAIQIFKGDIPKNKTNIFLVYFMCVVPHCLVHLPNTFVTDPIFAITSLIFTSVLFGTPMVWLIRNKNLQTSMAFHWFIDFVRFLFTFF